ncbi:ribosome silencing factor [Gracilimonas mengyeensis]|uniref:Ribosomal silencing factor RsfS n=1 Tax=Gracilimonas mengyeensis TaxID=1302730 RepID=A0A521FJ01_9BACT|nr:ribosome silencing factor [Gracilimonas mengyeensis]SMO96089.1 ribosome-associated protein [Gracilimonas mengyeensis]
MTNINQPAKQQFEHAFSGDSPDSKQIVELVTEALASKKGKDITVLDVSELTTLTDYFVVCHGTSDVQIKALADAVEEDLREKSGERVWKKEGLQGRAWVILDFVNIVVHIMSKEKREYYGIERMWNDAKVTHIAEEETE